MFMMNVQLLSKDIPLSESMHKYIDEKIAGLEKYCKDIIKAQVDITRDHHHQKGDVMRVEVNMSVPKKNLRVVIFSHDFRGAVDKIRGRLARQLKEYKRKVNPSFKERARNKSRY